MLICQTSILQKSRRSPFKNSYLTFAAVFFVFLSFGFKAFAEEKTGKFVIKKWQEFTKINETGRLSNATISGVNKDLSPGFMFHSYSVSFPPSRKINIIEARIDGKNQTFKFENNILTVNFPRGKVNSEKTDISFTYQELNLKANQGIRTEIISIPPIARGAKFFIAIDFGDSLEMVSGLEGLSIKNGVSLFNGVVSEKGVLKFLKFSRKSDGWSVKIMNKISFHDLSGNMIIGLPKDFVSGGQKVLNRKAEVNVKPTNTGFESGRRIMDFEITPEMKNINIREEVAILTGAAFRTPIIRENTNSMTYVSEVDGEILRPLIEKINSDPEFNSLPLYVKLAKYVHRYITYDKNYYGKLLNITDIMREKRGVCSEFATFYNALARAAGIPASIVYGYALGEYDKFEPHAWNMVFVDGEWKQIDPTWDLTSGVVSSSHIFLKDNVAEDIEVKFRGSGDDNIKLEKVVDIKPLKERATESGS